jgi:hypothetical protein
METSEIPQDTHHLGVPFGASKMMFKPMVRSTQIVHLTCVKISTVAKQTKTSSFVPHHLGLPSGASKMIPEPMVRLAQNRAHVMYQH